jgi:hypothetical protein
MTVQLQSISPIIPDSICRKAANFPRSGTPTIDIGCTTGSQNQQTITNDVIPSQSKTTPKTPSQVMKHQSAYENTLIRVTTSIATRLCSRLCPCKCHAKSHTSSPTWLRKVMGQILLSYHSFLRTTPCDYPPCRRTPRKTEFTYYFPYWFAQKALILSSEPGLSGKDASISIAMPVIIPGTHPIWNAIKSGNIPFIQQLFRQGFSPFVMDWYGTSLMSVRISFIFR